MIAICERAHLGIVVNPFSGHVGRTNRTWASAKPAMHFLARNRTHHRDADLRVIRRLSANCSQHAPHQLIDIVRPTDLTGELGLG